MEEVPLPSSLRLSELVAAGEVRHHWPEQALEVGLEALLAWRQQGWEEDGGPRRRINAGSTEGEVGGGGPERSHHGCLKTNYRQLFLQLQGHLVPQHLTWRPPSLPPSLSPSGSHQARVLSQKGSATTSASMSPPC